MTIVSPSGQLLASTSADPPTTAVDAAARGALAAPIVHDGQVVALGALLGSGLSYLLIPPMATSFRAQNGHDYLLYRFEDTTGFTKAGQLVVPGSTTGQSVRALTIGANLYLVSSAGVDVYRTESLTQIATSAFPSN